MTVGQIIPATAGFKHTSYGYLQNHPLSKHESVRDSFRALHSDYPLTPSIKNIFVKKIKTVCVCLEIILYHLPHIISEI